MFRDGLAQAYVSRVAGPGAAPATIMLKDTTPVTPVNTLAVTANSPGAWGNALTVQVVAGAAPNTYQLLIALGGVQVEATPQLTSPADAVGWSSLSNYVTVVAQVDATAAPNNNPAVVAATPLAAGLDDLASVTETQWTAALAAFSPDYGPGQVAAPGRTTVAAYNALIAHATDNDRTYCLDPADSPSAATLVGQAQAVQTATPIQPGQPDPGRGGIFAPWVLIPGLATGTAIPAPLRVVPPSALAMALMARSDTASGNPNAPAAGNNGGGTGSGVSTYAVGLTQPAWSDADRALLDGAGVNVVRNLGPAPKNQVQLYGFNTLSTDPAWSQLNWQRLRMAIQDQATLIAAADTEFAQIDGQGHLFAKFNGDLSAMLQRYWALGALYSTDSPPSAGSSFVVDTGPAVNPLSQIAQGIATAAISAHMSPFAKFSQIFFVKVPLGQPV
nr:hypothetical protein [Actinomycetota bacterium]